LKLFNINFDVDKDFSLPPKLTVTSISSLKKTCEKKFYGEAYHSGTSSDKGKNAIKVALDYALNKNLIITDIISGTGFSLIPDKAICNFSKENRKIINYKINVDFRTTPLYDDIWARNYIDNLLESLDIIYSYELLMNWKAYKLDEQEEPLLSMLKFVPDTTSLKIAGPSNIGNLLYTKDIKSTCGYGLGFENAHGANECVDINTIRNTYDVYLKSVLSIIK
jgi:succinyl-diaminopimelate desuccinylase